MKKQPSQITDTIKKLTKNHYQLTSSQSKLVYNIKRMQNADIWSCECARFFNQLREGKDKKCRHIQQITSMMSSDDVFEQKHMDASSPVCPFCDSTFIIKSGVRLHGDDTKRQLYRCKICKHRFSDRSDGFWHMHTHPRIITDALNLAMSGMSYRKISEHIRYSTGKTISHVSVGKCTL